MPLSSLAFLFEEAAKNIRRHSLMSFAALGTVAMSLAVFGGALYGIYRVNQVVSAQPSQLEILAFMHVKTRRSEALAVMQRIQKLPSVKSVNLVTKEQAWAHFMAEDRLNKTNLTTAVTGNPLPDRLDIRVKNPHELGAVADQLRNQTLFPQIKSVLDDHRLLKILLAGVGLLRVVGGLLAFLLFCATTFIIHNTLRLTLVARRREIRIMQLVGATSWFIRLPLVLEGTFHGLAGGIIAGVIVLIAANSISNLMSQFQSKLSLVSVSAGNPIFIVLLLAVAGALIGMGASLFSIRRFLARA